MPREAGITLPEMLVLVAIVGLAAGMGAMNLRPAEQPLQIATIMLEGGLRQARLQAIANTAAVRVAADGDDALVSESAGSCADTDWEPAPGGHLELPVGVSMAETDWVVCFTSRGISTDNVVITLTHREYGTRQVEVLIGGTTRVR